MARKFTPGPWNVLKSESKPAFNVVGTQLSEKWKIARCPWIDQSTGIIYENNKIEAEANARLIAQAPTMLDALNFEVEFLTEMIYELEQLHVQSYKIQRVRDRIGRILEILKEAIDGKV